MTEVGLGLGLDASVDALDSPDFDPIAYINARFPSESQLLGLEDYCTHLDTHIVAVSEEISRAIQTQAKAGKQASQDISEARTAILDLCVKIGDIKAKATQSEQMVQEICADIKKLDHAKTHLQTTISQLRKLQMLVTAVQQLELLAEQLQYREAADMLEAVKQLMTLFERYSSISRIAELQQRIERVRSSLSTNIFDVFADVGHLVDTVSDVNTVIESGGTLANRLKNLGDACLVIDALGSDARDKQLQHWIRTQLEQHDQVFAPGAEYSSLEYIERRYAWAKRLFRQVEEKYRTVFPKSWRVNHRLCIQFMQMTRDQIENILHNQIDPVCTDVPRLTSAVQKTLQFETQMAEKFEGRSKSEAERAEEAPLDLTTAEGIRKKYEREAIARQEEQERSNARTKYATLASDNPLEMNVIVEEEAPLPKIEGLLSGVFDLYLKPYVMMERNKLEDLLNTLQGQDDVDTEGGDGRLPVYNSSSHMMVYIKQSIGRCTRLSTGLTFLSLSREFKTCLSKYSEYLSSKIKSAVQQSPTSALGTDKGSTTHISVSRLSSSGERDLCYVINTADYCAETIPQLLSLVQQKISSEHVSAVDYQDEKDAFDNLVDHAIKMLVAGVEGKLDTAFRTMSSMQWGTMESVGEESLYVHQAHDALKASIPIIRDSLADVYFRNFCNKFAEAVLSTFLSKIKGQGRGKISEAGTQQLLLDTYSIKTVMLNLHRLGADPSDDSPSCRVPASYTKFVNQRVNKIETVLKLVATPEEMLAERFKIMWPDGDQQDLQSVMALKGMKRTDQNTVLEALGMGLQQKYEIATNTESLPQAYPGTSHSAASSSAGQSKRLTVLGLAPPTMPSMPGMAMPSMSALRETSKNISSSMQSALPSGANLHSVVGDVRKMSSSVRSFLSGAHDKASGATSGTPPYSYYPSEAK